jgi:hypothetical protein
MHSVSSGPHDGLIPEQPIVRPTRDPLPGRAGDSAEVTPQDRDRIAEGIDGMNDTVVHRLFSAGFCLQTALGLMGDHPGTAKVQEAVGELDLAIRDFRNVLFGHYQPDPPPAGGRTRAFLALPGHRSPDSQARS